MSQARHTAQGRGPRRAGVRVVGVFQSHDRQQQKRPAQPAPGTAERVTYLLREVLRQGHTKRALSKFHTHPTDSELFGIDDGTMHGTRNNLDWDVANS